MASTRDSDKRKIAEKQIFVKYLKFNYAALAAPQRPLSSFI